MTTFGEESTKRGDLLHLTVLWTRDASCCLIASHNLHIVFAELSFAPYNQEPSFEIIRSST